MCHQLKMHICQQTSEQQQPPYYSLKKASCRLNEKIFPLTPQKEATVCYCAAFSQGYSNTFQEAAVEPAYSAAPACFSVIAHHCCLCARASNNGLSWSCFTCFAEAFKSFHCRNYFIIFLWLIYNSQNVISYILDYVAKTVRKLLNKWLFVDAWRAHIQWKLMC